MSVDFNRIKKYSKASKEIDEKLEYLNKELKKTGIHEAMVTSKMYQMPKEVPNQDYINFNGLSHGGYALGLSAADGNGLGGAILGTNSQGATGVALSPPHPITGVRTSATHLLDGIGTGHPLQPGKSVYRGFFTKTLQTMGSALWFFDPNYNFSGQQGRWLNFEMFDGEWCFYDTNFMGFYFPNNNLDQYVLSGVNVGTQIKNKITGINFGAIGEIGPPQTIVLTQTKLSDPGFLPIPIDNLSTQGFNYLKRKAGVNVSSSYYSPEDKKNVINYYKKKQADPNYQPKPYERESLMRQMRAQGDGTQIASTDISTGFPPSPPDKFPVDPPPEVPDEPPAPPKPDPDPDSDRKKDPAGLDATAIKAGYNDPYTPVNPDGHYIALVSSAQEALSAEMDYAFYSAAANGVSPNYNTAAINKAKETLKNAREKLDNWERWKKENNYVWKGSIDSSAEAERRKNVLDKDKQIDNELEKLKKDQAQAEADAEMYAAEAQKLIAEFGIDVALTLFGYKILSLAGKAVGKIPAVAKFFKLGKAAQKAQIDDAVKAAKAAKSAEKAGKISKAMQDNVDDVMDNLFDMLRQGKTQNTKEARRFYDALNDAINAGDEKAIERIFQQIKKSKIKSQVPTPGSGSSASGSGSGSGSNFGQPFGNPKSGLDPGARYDLLMQSYKSKGKVLTEAAKLGHFEPEALTVDIEDLRKGIMPEFPKDPPPKLIGGYSEKSRLAPVKTPSNSSAADIKKKPFIKITKKDLARNHLLTDSDIKKFMDTINKVNEYIKNHPEELIYAQERYPFHDPRLAQLNWEMDEMLNAGKEYVDKQFPENQKLFDKIKKKIKNTIDQTDPKNFKGTKLPKFDNTSLEDFKRKKEVYSRFMKKPVKTKKLFQKTKKRG